MFSHEYVKLFSSTRLGSYPSLGSHFENIVFIQKITPKLLLIELMLRNSIDTMMQEHFGNKDWFTHILTQEELEDKANLTHDQIISRLSFGTWTLCLRSITPSNIQSSFINLEAINLEQYATKYQKMSIFTQTKLVFEIVRKIRNRAFHIERIKDVEIGFGRARYRIPKSNIHTFLDDVIISFEGKGFYQELMRFLEK